MAHRASTRLEAAKKVGDLVEQKQAETVLRLVEGLLRRLK